MRRSGLPDSCPGRFGVAGFFVRSALPWAVFAAALRPLPSQGENKVDTIVVTGEAVSTPERIAPTTFATVIDATEHAAELETVTDALAESVGIQVRRYGGLGAFSTVSIRGSASNQVQVYLDGIPLSHAQNETVNLADLPIDSIESIEVYRSVVPVTFGVGAPGGVVNLVTKRPTVDPSADLSVAYGSFETRKAVASYSQSVHDVDVLAHVSYLGSKGDFEFKEDATPALPGGKTSVTRRNNEFDSVNALVRASYAFASGTEVDVTSELFYKDQGVPGPVGTFSIPGPGGPALKFDTRFEELRSLNYLRVSRPRFLSDAIDVSGTIFGTYDAQRFVDTKGQLGRGVQDRDDTSVIAGGNATATYLLSPAQTTTWFSELSYETFSPRNVVQTRPNDPDQTRLRYAFAFQDDAWLAPDLVLFSPSIRYVHLDDDVSASFSPAGLPEGRQHVGRDLWSGNMGMQVIPFEWLVLKGNLGRYQRAPNFSELFGNTVGIIGNPRLKPETAINRDVGFVLTPTGLPPWAEASVEYAYFNNDIDDLITLVQTSPSTARALNIGAARIRGHEVVVNADVFEHLSFDLNYTHQDAEDRSNEVIYRGKPLPFRPADELYTRVEVYDDWGKVYYEFNFIGSNRLRRLGLARDQVDERNIHTAGVGVSPTDWLTLRFEGRNLSDNQLRDVANYPLPGRSFFGSVTAQF